ncbi:MAG: secondary thiamine-phosphate synthase enzyme YjbQ [Candidatus Woesearchaeota archaeon]
MKRIDIHTSNKEEIIDITKEIIESIDIEDGFVYIYCPHTTAGITINENYDPTVKDDVIKSLNDIVKELESFRHMEGNSTAHMKSILTGKTLQIAVEGGKLVLGRWDGIYFCDYDGPRKRHILIKTQEAP